MSKFIFEENKNLKKNFRAKKFKDGSQYWGMINRRNVREGFGKEL